MEKRKARRKKAFQFRLNDQEYERLHKYADQVGVPASEVLRDLIKNLPITDNENAAT